VAVVHERGGEEIVEGAAVPCGERRAVGVVDPVHEPWGDEAGREGAEVAEDEEAGGIGVAEVPVRERGRESGQEETDGFGGEGRGDDEGVARDVACGEVEEGSFVVFDGDDA
jgi:hypothetical protein